MSPTATSIHTAYELARERYAALGVDTEAALAALGQRRPFPCTAGRATTWAASRAWRRPRRRHRGHRQLPRQGAQRRRAPPRPGRGLACCPAAPPQPARHLRGAAAEGGRDATAARALSRLDRLGQGPRPGPRLQPDLLRPPQGGRRLHPRHPDPAVRRFWIEHGVACRRIGEDIGRALGKPAVTNVWIPDGDKDTPADRWSPRAHAPIRWTRSWPSPDRSRYSAAMRSRASCSASAARSYVMGSSSSTPATPSAAADTLP